MNATFLVTVDVLDETAIPDTALDIEDDLLSAGHDVIVVKPWARPTIGLESSQLFGGGAEPERPPSLF
jgi:hypothetical protein